jgi:hypothetical protein
MGPVPALRLTGESHTEVIDYLVSILSTKAAPETPITFIDFFTYRNRHRRINEELFPGSQQGNNPC